MQSAHVIIGCGIALDTIIRTLMNILTTSNYVKEFEENFIEASRYVLSSVEATISTQNAAHIEQAIMALKYFTESICTLFDRILDNKAGQVFNTVINRENGLFMFLIKLLTISTSENN